MEDANFDRKVANQAISYLYTEEELIRSILEDNKNGLLRGGQLLFMDIALSNEINYLIEATAYEFESMCYREGNLLI